ncbi:hypothetical protein KUTeg_006855 [Tegillarca granosa]|uniref:Uncharacterized protein n=1 Tax=Tegillarca granosa TaxID=220873 RepID=A0ABQ9FBJ3_TEGGR|nr:hypothetical protein KUTeg_006855 [Tegillarca granosa]
MFCAQKHTLVKLQKLDILFMMDASGSVTEPSFIQSLNFVSNFTEFFQIGPDNTQVSVYSFDNRNVYGFNLNKHQDTTSLRNAININNIHYYALKENFTMALQFARETVFAPENGARNDSLKVIIFITDGKSKVGNQVELLREQNIQIIAVGVGNQTDVETLKKIATSTSNVFTVGSYDAINTIQDFVLSPVLANKFCESGPCKNQGTCLNLQNDYHCLCLPGTSGKDCSIKVSMFLKCLASRSGDPNECDSNPCLNNGVCIDGINTYTCQCKGGYAGKNCQTNGYFRNNKEYIQSIWKMHLIPSILANTTYYRKYKSFKNNEVL